MHLKLILKKSVSVNKEYGLLQPITNDSSHYFYLHNSFSVGQDALIRKTATKLLDAPHGSVSFRSSPRENYNENDSYSPNNKQLHSRTLLHGSCWTGANQQRHKLLTRPDVTRGLRMTISNSNFFWKCLHNALFPLSTVAVLH